MIRFAFTPSTIRHSFSSLSRKNKARGGQKATRILFNAVIIALLVCVIPSVFYGGWILVKNLAMSDSPPPPPPPPPPPLPGFNPEDWQSSDARQPGERQTLKIGNNEYGFVWIPAGEFQMGSSRDETGRYDDEKLHLVKLTKGFWMLETETTRALYNAFMKTSSGDSAGENLPVEQVSWNDAMTFCRELTKRLPGVRATLPTEAQWEYACRAGTTTAYCYGDGANPHMMNCKSNGTTPVRSYPLNKWGLYDMHGNVWEWTLDYYEKDYPTGTAIDPTGPDNASYRVERGGGWSASAEDCRSAFRNKNSADYKSDVLGFRFILICD